jgi:hypothetical protein
LARRRIGGSFEFLQDLAGFGSERVVRRLLQELLQLSNGVGGTLLTQVQVNKFKVRTRHLGIQFQGALQGAFRIRQIPAAFQDRALDKESKG